MNRPKFSIAAFLFTLGFSAAARTDNPLGFYLGGALGSSNVRLDAVESDPLLYNAFHQSSLGWKAFAGIRPISLIGAELQYVDFGNPSDSNGDEVHQHAAALYGMLYAPIPLPSLDVYAKAGVAWLHSNANGQISNPYCQAMDIPCGTLSYTYSRNDTDAAFGAGVQFKFSRLAIRAEYERIQTSVAKPDLASIGLAWTF